MPFTCKSVTLDGQLREPELIFDEWIDEVFTTYVPRGAAFANAHDSLGRCVLRMAGPGVPSTKPNLIPGSPITVGTIVLYFAADGEDIPYNRPYCDLDYLNADTEP